MRRGLRESFNYFDLTEYSVYKAHRLLRLEHLMWYLGHNIIKRWEGHSKFVEASTYMVRTCKEIGPALPTWQRSV